MNLKASSIFLAARTPASVAFDKGGRFGCINVDDSPDLEVKKVLVFKPNPNGRRDVRVRYFDGNKVDYKDACFNFSNGVGCDFNSYSITIAFKGAAKVPDHKHILEFFTTLF